MQLNKAKAVISRLEEATQWEEVPRTGKRVNETLTVTVRNLTKTPN